jgi:hypothetical protein
MNIALWIVQILLVLSNGVQTEEPALMSHV